MRRLLSLLAVPVLLCALLACVTASGEEKQAGFVARVTTEKGSLKLRRSADPKGRVAGEIPNGTCLLVEEEDGDWCKVSWNGLEGWCKTAFLILYREADTSLLDYRVLRAGDKGDDVVALKKRLQELGYIRGSASLTNRYTEETAQRVVLFQRQTGIGPAIPHRREELFHLVKAVDDALRGVQFSRIRFDEPLHVRLCLFQRFPHRFLIGEDQRQVPGLFHGDVLACAQFHAIPLSARPGIVFRLLYGSSLC